MVQSIFCFYVHHVLSSLSPAFELASFTPLTSSAFTQSAENTNLTRPSEAAASNHAPGSAGGNFSAPLFTPRDSSVHCQCLLA